MLGSTECGGRVERRSDGCGLERIGSRSLALRVVGSSVSDNLAFFMLCSAWEFAVDRSGSEQEFECHAQERRLRYGSNAEYCRATAPGDEA